MSFQIVTGKLLSKLFQIILLLAISLPLLAIIRIFGGVSWSYIISSLCITLTAVIFAGSVSMFFSVLFRRDHIVIILAVLVLIIILGGDYFLSQVIHDLFRIRIHLFRTSPSYVTNPIVLLHRISDEMMSPGRIRIGYSWIVYCAFSLFSSFIILFASGKIVRKVALSHALGQKSFFEKLFSRRVKKFHHESSSSSKVVTDDTIRRVWGPPIAWKEMKTKFSSREKMLVVIIIGIELLMIIAMYLFPFMAVSFGYEQAHIVYIYIFMGLSMFSTAIFSSGCITSEKEANTWPLLLITTLSDWEILYGKLVGIMRRSLPIWIMLFIYFCPFLNFEGHGFMTLLFLITFIFGIITFLYGAGLYISTRFKDTSAAIIAYFAFMSVLWFIMPLIINSRIIRIYLRHFDYRPIMRSFMVLNPFQIGSNNNDIGYAFFKRKYKMAGSLSRLL